MLAIDEALSLLSYLLREVVADDQVAARMVKVDVDDMVPSVPWRAYALAGDGDELDHKHTRWASLRDVCAALEGWEADTRRETMPGGVRAVVEGARRLDPEARAQVVAALLGGETRPTPGRDNRAHRG